MGRILIGIATHEPDQRFLESVPLFYADASKKYDIDIKWVWHKPLVDAQNELAKATIDGKYDYLLTIEDDHHGFTVEMLDACMKPDTMVCGISYRSRHFPFMKIPMFKTRVNKVGENQYGNSSDITEGYHEVDLSAFGFTLIKREVFDILDKPYFQLNVVNEVKGPRATDINFSKRLQARGIKLIGCFDHLLNHRDIDEDNIKEMIVKGVIAKHSLYTRLNRMLDHDRKMTKEKANA